MTDAHAKFCRREVIVMSVLNTVANGLFGWLMFRKNPSIPVWGQLEAVAPDLMITGFFLGFLVCLTGTLSARKKVVKLGLGPVAFEAIGMAGMLPDSLWKRAVWVGLTGSAMASLLIGLLAFIPGQAMSTVVYSALKGVASGGFTLVCALFSLLRVFAERQPATLRFPVRVGEMAADAMLVPTRAASPSIV
jgi:hypothetical protein